MHAVILCDLPINHMSVKIILRISNKYLLLPSTVTTTAAVDATKCNGEDNNSPNDTHRNDHSLEVHCK